METHGPHSPGATLPSRLAMPIKYWAEYLSVRRGTGAVKDAVERQCKGSAKATRRAPEPLDDRLRRQRHRRPAPKLRPELRRPRPDCRLAPLANSLTGRNTQTLKQSRTPRTMAGSQICGPALYGVRLQRHRQRVGVAGGDRGEDGGDQRGGLPGGEGEVECLPGRRGADLEPRAAVSRLGQRAAGRQAGGQGAQTGAAARAA